MSLFIHTINAKGGSTFSKQDQIEIANLLAIPSALGSGAGATVVTAVTFAKPMGSANYTAFVTPSVPGIAEVTNKTAAGCTVTLTPLSGVTLAAGTFDLLVVG